MAEIVDKGLGRREFAARMAHYMVEVYVVHPFREGSGRVMRQYLFVLAEHEGYDVALDVLKEGWLDACVKTFGGD